MAIICKTIAIRLIPVLIIVQKGTGIVQLTVNFRIFNLLQVVVIV